MSEPDPLRWGLATCGLLVLLSLLVGEIFPLSRFSMFAGLSDRDHGAVPVFEIGGQPGDPLEMAAFAGLDPTHFVPIGLATSQEHRLVEAREHILSHPAPPGADPARAKPIVLAWRVFRIRDGRIVEERLVADEGLAWPAAP